MVICVPRSQKKRISDMLDLLESDEILRRRFAELVLSVVEHDLHLTDKMTDIISKELASRMRSPNGF